MSERASRTEAARAASELDAEDGLLRAMARILREAADAERASRPALRILQPRRRGTRNLPLTNAAKR